jgi:hypothetical protein
MVPIHSIPEMTLNIDDALLGGKIHSKGTLVLTLTGPDAARVSYSYILNMMAGPGGIGAAGVAEVYRFASPFKFYVTLSTAAHVMHYARLHGKILEGTDRKVTILIEHEELERDKGTLHYVPATAKPEVVLQIVKTITQDEKAEIRKIEKASDKWEFYYRSEAAIPHFFHLNLKTANPETPPIQMEILIILQGRRVQCQSCGMDTHWQSQCPLKWKREERPERRDNRSENRGEDTRGDIGKDRMQGNTDDVRQDIIFVHTQKETDDEGFTTQTSKKRNRRESHSSISPTAEIRDGTTRKHLRITTEETCENTTPESNNPRRTGTYLQAQNIDIDNTDTDKTSSDTPITETLAQKQNTERDKTDFDIVEPVRSRDTSWTEDMDKEVADRGKSDKDDNTDDKTDDDTDNIPNETEEDPEAMLKNMVIRIEGVTE